MCKNREFSCPCLQLLGETKPKARLSQPGQGYRARFLGPCA